MNPSLPIAENQEPVIVKRVPVIVENERAFSDTLFRPINGRTADGYIAKRHRASVDVFILGRKLRVNAYGVWCEPSIREDGQTIWSHAILILSAAYGYANACNAADNVLAMAGISRRYE